MSELVFKKKRGRKWGPQREYAVVRISGKAYGVLKYINGETGLPMLHILDQIMDYVIDNLEFIDPSEDAACLDCKYNPEGDFYVGERN